jgi:hypothetical protein
MPLKIADEEWNLPISISPTGDILTLRDVTNLPSHESILKLDDMPPDKRTELVIKRIENQPKFEINMVGVGVVDQNRALAEIAAGSDAGRSIVEIEEMLIRKLMDKLKK